MPMKIGDDGLARWDYGSAITQLECQHGRLMEEVCQLCDRGPNVTAPEIINRYGGHHRIPVAEQANVPGGVMSLEPGTVPGLRPPGWKDGKRDYLPLPLTINEHAHGDDASHELPRAPHFPSNRLAALKRMQHSPEVFPERRVELAHDLPTFKPASTADALRPNDRHRLLPTDTAARKNAPMATGCLDYFPLALAAVAELSRIGNDKHNPGEPLHWSRGKSDDHADCIIRHMMERGTIDTDGMRHSVKIAWRALALLQLELEAAKS